MDFILASGSPRRKELLAAAGYEFSVVVPDVEERMDMDGVPGVLTVWNAALKAEAVAAVHGERWVVGADTLVFLDGKPLGKPENLHVAREMLRSLSGREHEVVTGVALRRCGMRAEARDFFETTLVRFRRFDERVIERYLESVSVLDKAGSYAVQEKRDWLVEEVEGDESNVMGFPVRRFMEEWRVICEG